MSKTLRSIERILAVQKQKLHLAEWKIFDLQRQRSALVENQVALTSLLDTETAPGNNLAIIAMRTSRRASLAAARLQQAEVLAKDQMHHVYRQVKLSEHVFTDRKSEEKRQEDKKLLDDIIDRITYP